MVCGADARTVQKQGVLVQEAGQQAWWASYPMIDTTYGTLIGLESSAKAIVDYRTSTVPGLLQTPDYLRAYLRTAIDPSRENSFSDSELHDRLEVAQRRQGILQPGTPLAYSAFLDEACLRRIVGGEPAMADQVHHIIELMQYPHISVRVLPFALGAHAGQPGGFGYFKAVQPHRGDVVYIDSSAGQLLLDDPDQLERCRRVLTALDRAALPADDSRRFLAAAEDCLRRRLPGTSTSCTSRAP
jgi:hypothetical protein